LGEAERYIMAHQNFTSYLLLDHVRERFPELYGNIPEDTKAAILCDELVHTELCNDWGTLQHDSEAARALISTGRSAIPYLRQILDDARYIHYDNFKLYTPSSRDHYRRCDFAYRYACLIQGLEPEYDPDPKIRDASISRLKTKLGQSEPRK
jgi:hypothetical protein